MRPLLALALLAAPAAAHAQQPQGCASPESRQFDFWVGTWDVYAFAKPDKPVAKSRIEKLYLGCAIRENWRYDTPAGGGSLNAYVPAEHAWRQTWIDSSGARVEFTGGWTGQAMVLTGVWPQPGHPTQITRMTFTPMSDGSVRQAGEVSDDAGKTWSPGFDFLYRKVAGGGAG